MLRIVYLYAKFPPYQVPVIRELSQSRAQVTIVYWDNPGHAPYTPPSIDGDVRFIPRSSIDDHGLCGLLADRQPDIIVISGWQDKGYMRAVKPWRRTGTPVVIGFDEIWRGTLRQQIGRVVFPVWLKQFYSHAWVSGPRQYEFAKKLGFRDNRIINHLYSADTSHFQQFQIDSPSRLQNYPRSFLFVGRMVPDKGIDILAEGFDHYRNRLQGDWELVCVGNGPMSDRLRNRPGVTLHSYMSQSDLFQLMQSTGAFVLASRFDVSPLVVHEFASAGFPLILSDAVGNRLLFLIERFNGQLFQSGNAEALAKAMKKIDQMPTYQLVEMGKNSRMLSMAHNPKFVAASLLSVANG
jgi:glycosyltransferase involved in cell wall biosynthesis